MNYILDTHVLLWWLDDPNLLSKKAKNVIQDSANLVYVSSVSTWEIVIKESLGKLKIPKDIFQVIKKANFVELPISIEHTKYLSTLPSYHKDPFDRLLIVQTMVEKSALITNNQIIQKYPISITKA